MFKESNTKLTRWRDIDYDILSDNDSVEPLYEDPYASQIKRMSMHGSQQFPKGSTPLYDMNGQIQKLTLSEFNHAIDFMYNQFPEVPTGNTITAGNWVIDSLDSLPLDDTILNLLHDFCFGDNVNILAFSKVLEEVRRIIPAIKNSSISLYLSALIKAKLEDSEIFRKPVKDLGIVLDHITREELIDLQNLELKKYRIYINERMDLNEVYKIENQITYLGPKNSVTVNLAHIPLCDNSLSDAFFVTFPNSSITIKRGKTEPVEVCIKIPNLILQELISVEINHRGRLFFVLSCTSSSGIFGVYPKHLPCSMDHDSNVIVPNALQYLKKKLINNNGYQTSRIFRESASITEKTDAIEQLNDGNNLTYSNPSLYANLLLYYLRTLPKPLLHFVTYESVLKLDRKSLMDYNTQAKVMYSWMDQMEKSNRDVLIFISDIFCQVLLNHQETQMNVESFSVLLIPNIFIQESNEEYLMVHPLLTLILNGWLIDRMIHTFNFTYDTLLDMHIIEKSKPLPGSFM